MEGSLLNKWATSPENPIPEHLRRQDRFLLFFALIYESGLPLPISPPTTVVVMLRKVRQFAPHNSEHALTSSQLVTLKYQLEMRR